LKNNVNLIQPDDEMKKQSFDGHLDSATYFRAVSYFILSLVMVVFALLAYSTITDAESTDGILVTNAIIVTLYDIGGKWFVMAVLGGFALLCFGLGIRTLYKIRRNLQP
jgi:hypothetical protein